MIDLNAALDRYDEIVLSGRKALKTELENRAKETNVILWFEHEEFIADLEHFLNEVLSEDKTYLFGEDFATGKKVSINPYIEEK